MSVRIARLARYGSWSPPYQAPGLLSTQKQPFHFVAVVRRTSEYGNLLNKAAERVSVPSHLWMFQAPRGGNVPITYLSTVVDVVALLLGLDTDTARDLLKLAPSDVKRLTHCLGNCMPPVVAAAGPAISSVGIMVDPATHSRSTTAELAVSDVKLQELADAEEEVRRLFSNFYASKQEFAGGVGGGYF